MESTVEFSDWLLEELNKREWNQADLVRKSKLKSSTLSRLITGQRNPGKKTAKAIALALGYPPEYIFRLAGILPPERETDPTEEELIYLYGTLTESERQEALDWLRYKSEKKK